MLDLQRIIIENFLENIEHSYLKNYGVTQPLYGAMAAWAGRLSLEQIANCNALYHNVEHTIMVTIVGQALLQGKHMIDGGVKPQDWLHFTLALLFHDIGYVRNICQIDDGNHLATGIDDETFIMPLGATDAILEPYHVDRSKLFVRERFGDQLIHEIDGDRIASYIEMTRFPINRPEKNPRGVSYQELVQAADVIGQLGDPNYLRKIPALYYEFMELDKNDELGYKNPADMRENYARFFWQDVSPYIQDALRYLRVTQEGKQWIANLYAHVFEVEHGVDSLQLPAN